MLVGLAMLLMTAPIISSDSGQMTVTATPKSAVIYTGNAIAFLCKATDARQPVTYQWFKDSNGTRVKIGDVKQDPGFLTIRHVNYSDHGTYICVATSENQTVDTSVLLIDPDDAEIILPKRVVIPYGQKKLITCRVRSTFPIDKVIFPERPRYLNTSTINIRGKKARADLLIDNRRMTWYISLDPEASGDYKCTAIVRGKKYSKTIYIQIEAMATLLHVFVGERVVYLKPGSDHEFLCLGYGIPTPKVTWLSGSRELTTNDGITQKYKKPARVISNFKITNFTLDMVGNYSCVAENSYGSEFRNYTILRQGPPGQPKLSGHRVKGQKVRLQITPSQDDGGAVTMSYNITYHSFPQGKLYKKNVMKPNVSFIPNDEASRSWFSPTLRLADGKKSAGLVEVFRNGRWGLVCADMWTIHEARVVCRMLGYRYPFSVSVENGHGKANVLYPFHFDCDGTEMSLTVCYQKPYARCKADRAAGVGCQDGHGDADTNSGTWIWPKVRLTGGEHKWSGQVEVFLEGRWGLINSDFFATFGMKEGDVICRMLGYRAAHTASTKRINDGEFALFSVKCQGNEISIVNCVNRRKQRLYSTSKNAATVVCHGPGLPKNPGSLTQPPIRLANGYAQTGVVEVYHEGRWGVICDDGWGIKEAQVVCRMLGYKYAKRASIRSEFGRSSNFLLDDVSCSGSEMTLQDCVHGPWGVHDCEEHEAAGVVCGGLKMSGPSVITLNGIASAHAYYVSVKTGNEYGASTDAEILLD